MWAERASERRENQPGQTRFSGGEGTTTWQECQVELNAISQRGFTENQPQTDINPGSHCTPRKTGIKSTWNGMLD